MSDDETIEATDEAPLETRPYPINFDALAKGSRIAPEEIERIFHLERSDKKYALRALALAERITHHFETSRGEVVTVKMDADALRILTDAEAIVYNDTEYQRGLRKSFRAHRRAVGIDVRNLDAAEVEEHRRRSARRALVLGAVRKARAQFTAQEHKRTTPALGDGEAK
jgi:hypothetical protein